MTFKQIQRAANGAYKRLKSHPRWDEVQRLTFRAQPNPTKRYKSLKEGLDAGLKFFRKVGDAQLLFISGPKPGSADDVVKVLLLASNAAYMAAGLPFRECINDPSPEIQRFQRSLAKLERDFTIRAYRLAESRRRSLARAKMKAEKARKKEDTVRARIRQEWFNLYYGGKEWKEITPLITRSEKPIRAWLRGETTKEPYATRLRRALADGAGRALHEVPE
jgi:hypothetical protein